MSEEEARKVKINTLRFVIVAVPIAWVILMIVLNAFDIPLGDEHLITILILEVILVILGVLALLRQPGAES